MPLLWTALVLHPPSARLSSLTTLAPGLQAGDLGVGPFNRASLWRGSAETFVDLHPPDAEQSWISAAEGAAQIGSVQIGNAPRAAMWTGTPESRVDLNPAAAAGSFALGAGGVHQVGIAFLPAGQRAALWSGTPESFVDLGARADEIPFAIGVGGGLQVGYAFVGGGTHARQWAGTPASLTDLHPLPADDSYALATDGRRHCGVLTIAARNFAAIFDIASDQWITLMPRGARSSFITHMADRFFAGSAGFPDGNRALLWESRPDGSFRAEDLSAALPSGWTNAHARAVRIEGDTLTAAGSAVNPATGEQNAVLWRRDARGEAASMVIDVEVLPRRPKP